MKKTKYPWFQTRLRSGKTEQIVWLEGRIGVVPGAFVHLKDDPRKWEVVEQYRMEKVYDPSELDKKWKVGGLA